MSAPYSDLIGVEAPLPESLLCRLDAKARRLLEQPLEITDLRHSRELVMQTEVREARFTVSNAAFLWRYEARDLGSFIGGEFDGRALDAIAKSLNLVADLELWQQGTFEQKLIHIGRKNEAPTAGYLSFALGVNPILHTDLDSLDGASIEELFEAKRRISEAFNVRLWMVGLEGVFSSEHNKCPPTTRP